MLRRQVKVRLDSTPLKRQVNEINFSNKKSIFDNKDSATISDINGVNDKLELHSSDTAHRTENK